MRTMFRTSGAVALALSLLSFASVRANTSAPNVTAEKPAPAMPVDLFEQPIPPAVPEIPPPSTVIAVVNGEQIKQSTVNEYVDRALMQGAGRYPPERQGEVRATLNRQITEDLITQTLLLQTAVKQKIEVSDAEVDEALTKIPLPDGKTLDQALQSQNLSLDSLKSEVRRAMKIDKLLKTVAEKTAEPTDGEVKKFYEENKTRFEQPDTVTASHILIRVPEGSDDRIKTVKKELAEKIRKELLAGADFAEAAKKYSEDPGSKDKGGEYTFPRGMMVKAFEDAAFSQELNKIGDLVETPFGFHIIKTTKKNPPRTVPLEEVAPVLKQRLGMKAKGEAVRKYIDGLRLDAKIEIPGPTKASAGAPAAPQK